MSKVKKLVRLELEFDIEKKDTCVVIGTTKLFDDMTRAFKCFDEVEEKLEELSIMLEEIADFVKEKAEPNDLVITMGAGDIYKVGEMVLSEN